MWIWKIFGRRSWCLAYPWVMASLPFVFVGLELPLDSQSWVWVKFPTMFPLCTRNFRPDIELSGPFYKLLDLLMQIKIVFLLLACIFSYIHRVHDMSKMSIATFIPSHFLCLTFLSTPIPFVVRKRINPWSLRVENKLLPISSYGLLVSTLHQSFIYIEFDAFPFMSSPHHDNDLND